MFLQIKLTITIPPALTILPVTGSVTVTVPWLLFVVLVLAPVWTIWAPARLAAGMVIMPVTGTATLAHNTETRQKRRQEKEGKV